MISHREFYGDAEHDFTLGADQIRELERTTGAGIGLLCQRVFAGSFSHFDITETIRLALIGGGLDPAESAALIRSYTIPRPIQHAMLLAVAILSALYFGTPAAADEPLIVSNGYADVVNVLAARAAA